MELTSLHPFDIDLVGAYVAAATDGSAPARVPPALVQSARQALARAESGQDANGFALTYGLGQLLATAEPSFVQQGLSLTAWEARIDRGVGMLMRPPARLLIDAGLDAELARGIATRLDLSRGMMGGAFIPARLVPELAELLEKRFERSVRRLVDAEMDPVLTFGLMIEAVDYARQRGLGLFEAIDVVSDVTGMSGSAGIVVADRKRLDPDLRKRIERAAKPEKKPGLFAKMLGRGGARSGNGRASYPNDPFSGGGEHR